MLFTTEFQKYYLSKSKYTRKTNMLNIKDPLHAMHHPTGDVRGTVLQDIRRPPPHDHGVECACHH